MARQVRLEFAETDKTLRVLGQRRRILQGGRQDPPFQLRPRRFKAPGRRRLAPPRRASPERFPPELAARSPMTDD